MDNTEFYALAFAVGVLAAISIMYTKLFKSTAEAIVQLRTDVEFLKDHTVARETEARP